MVYCFHYHYRLPSETTGKSDEPIRSTPLDKAMKKTPEKKMTKPKRPASAQHIRRILILSSRLSLLRQVQSPFFCSAAMPLRTKSPRCCTPIPLSLFRTRIRIFPAMNRRYCFYLLILPPCSTIPTTPLSPRRHETRLKTG